MSRVAAASRADARVRAPQAADAAQRGGASLKTLTLAPGVRAKAATHAVCCETLKCAPLCRVAACLAELLTRLRTDLSVIQALCADAGLLPPPDDGGEAAVKRRRRGGEGGGWS